jgi:sugar phosphate isomerase/epimerase
MRPKIAVCNIFNDTTRLKSIALDSGFDGIDWSFDLDNLPLKPSDETKWVKQQLMFSPLEVRYHCPFNKIDLGHDDPREAKRAETIFHRVVRLVSKSGGKYLSIHIGLGRNSTRPLSWEDTIGNLRNLVHFGAIHNVKICLENLGWGWTSKPNLFEKLIRRSGAGVTFDFGHAHSCESVTSQHYSMEDFVAPHADRVYNAHIYHTEISGVGHLPPENPEDLKSRLDLLWSIGCQWWAIEIRELENLLATKNIIDEYLKDRASN